MKNFFRTVLSCKVTDKSRAIQIRVCADLEVYRESVETGALIVPLGGLVSFDPGLKMPPTDIIISREDVVGVRLDPNDPLDDVRKLFGDVSSQCVVNVVGGCDDSLRTPAR